MLVKGNKHRFDLSHTLVERQKKNQVEIARAIGRMEGDLFSKRRFGLDQIAETAMCQTQFTYATGIVRLKRCVALPKLDDFFLRRFIFCIPQELAEFINSWCVIFAAQLAQ